MSFRAVDRKVLLPVYLATLGTWSAYALVTVVLPFRFQELGLSVVEYGVALAIYALGTLATEGLWGYLAFRIGSPRWLGGLGLVTVVSMVALGFARSFPAFVLVLAVYGMLVVYSTPLIRWIGLTASGPGTESRGLGRLGLFFGIGLSLGTAVGPLLFTIGGFWLNLAVGAAVFVLGTVPLLRVSWPDVPLPRARTGGFRSLGALLERQFLVATVLVVLFFMVYTLVTNFLQYYSLGLFHGSIEQSGYIIGGARAVSVVAGVLLGSQIDRWGPGRTAPVGFLLLGVGAVGTWFSLDYSEMAAATMVLAAGTGCLSVSLLPMALARILPAHQGTAVGVFGSFEDLGLVLGPLLLGAVYEAWGPRALFPVTGVLAFAGLGLALAARASRAADKIDRAPA